MRRRDARSAKYWFQVASSTARVKRTLDLAAAASYPALMIASAASKLNAPHFCTGTEMSMSAFSMFWSSLAEIMTDSDWPRTEKVERFALGSIGASAR